MKQRVPRELHKEERHNLYSFFLEWSDEDEWTGKKNFGRKAWRIEVTWKIKSRREDNIEIDLKT
jgi:hypothetical protein